MAVKCATITPNAQRVEEYGLKQMWKSPNGTIRAMMDGTVFRTPILVPGISPCVRNWKKPITIARHAYGDVYKNTEIRVPGPGKAELVLHRTRTARETRETIMRFRSGRGVVQGMHNTDESIRFLCPQLLPLRAGREAGSVVLHQGHHFQDLRPPLQGYFCRRCTRQTISAAFEEAGITYFYTLIDDAVARVIRSEGGFIWALQELRRRRDERYGRHGLRFSLAMMTSCAGIAHRPV